MTIKRLLVANRGEIACRVMKTAKALGIETVAVYSDADKGALHVKSADHSVHIGGSLAAESYLNIDNIISAAKNSGSDAIHPGYGFLSENTTFAGACEKAGIIFVGPSANAIDLMGDKARAKRAMIEAGVPCIPGYQGDDQDNKTLKKEAKQIGFPQMIKAAAGGGGRGMRLVHKLDEVDNALEAARSEAINAFGSGELILEKAVQRARHVEVQVFGDTHGNVVYLGERDCSVQRRHQKVIEEAPCPVMTPELRQQMGDAAVSAARAVDYVGAGTVEFLLGEDREFYFLEMNTRLQVEHPVTEEITGLDLVELQLSVAAGEPLGFDQADVKLKGHAIEVRLYAEDPNNDFLPSTGRIERWLAPKGPGIRVDAGVESGGEVSPFYDPMIAKVIATGSNREEARQRLVSSLSTSSLIGPATNRDFLIDTLNREAFSSGEATTSFIEEEYGDSGYSSAPSTNDYCLAAITQYKVRNAKALLASTGVNPELVNWASADPLESVFTYKDNDDTRMLVIRPTGSDSYSVSTEDETIEATVSEQTSDSIRIDTGNERHSILFHASADDQVITIATESIQFTVKDISGGEALEDAGGDGVISAPMHGQLLEVLVNEGDSVTKGQKIAVLEAMKMQHEILAEVTGTVTRVHADADTQIALGTIILEIEAE